MKPSLVGEVGSGKWMNDCEWTKADSSMFVLLFKLNLDAITRTEKSKTRKIFIYFLQVEKQIFVETLLNLLRSFDAL